MAKDMKTLMSILYAPASCQCKKNVIKIIIMIKLHCSYLTNLKSMGKKKELDSARSLILIPEDP